MTEESKEKVVVGKGVVEQRLKPSLIRRRAKVTETPEPPPETPVEVQEGSAPETTAETGSVQPAETNAEVSEPKLGVIAPPPQVSTSPKPAVEQRPHLGVVGFIGDVVPEVREGWKDRLKKAPKKKKSRAELEMESIQRAGGLKHFVDQVLDEVPAEKPAAPHVVMEERVFQPVPSGRRKRTVRREFRKTQVTERRAIKKVIRIEDRITVSGLSQAIGVKASDIIKKLMGSGLMVTANQTIDVETATLLAGEHGYTVEHTAFNEEDVLAVPDAHVSVDNLMSRAPVVTVMGHVDHGKTSILDAIRKTKVVDKEAGGITQHIGAYEVNLAKGSITFLDTPGHEAFTSMRARGAQATDIVVLVVAADDGIMPQTIEAIDHAKAAEVPIIVAINKMDLAQAKPDVVKKELTEHGLLPEEWGGETICVPTSARTKDGIEKLLEMILLQAEMLELTADPTLRPKGIVIEARLDKSRGPVASILVQEGTLRAGQSVVCGVNSGRIRAMFDADGFPCEEAGPSKPVEIIGLSGMPDAGDMVIGVDSEQSAKLVSEIRAQKLREQSLRKGVRFSLEDLQTKVTSGESKELPIILKTDVQGSVEAISEAVKKLSTDQVRLKIIHSGVGGVTESDVLLARASEAAIIGFNVLADQIAEATAEREGVGIRTYRIIYDLVDDVRKAMEGLLAPELSEKIIGRAEIREIFNISKVGTIAGCQVTNGVIQRSARVRLLRDQAIVFEGKLASLKRFKEDVREVAEGYECGMSIENFNDIKQGDQIVAYIIEKKAATL
jgi:translation initiation factor IF-2